MSDDKLSRLLADAEAGWTPPVSHAQDLLARVRQAAARRERWARRLAVAAPVAGLVMLAGGWLLFGPRTGPARHDSSTVAQAEALLQEIAELRAAADYHAVVARRLIAAADEQRKVDSLRAELSQADPLDDVRLQADVVAYRMILRADALGARNMTSAEAAGVYRNVIELFPDTHSAEVARDRLAALNLEKRDA